MKDYNIFEEFVDTLEIVNPFPRNKYTKIAFMGKKGDHKQPLYSGEDQQSNFRTTAYVLCLYIYDLSVEWKCVYKNTKGWYIKYNKKNVYVDVSDNVAVVKIY